MSEHGGTHIDSPRHFAEGKNTVDQIPLEQLIGPAVVIDVSQKSDANADYLVTTADIEEWEKAHARIPANTIVLLRTGFRRRWPDAAKYLGTAERGEQAVPKLHFPASIPMPQSGSSRTDRPKRSASTRRASITASRRCSRRTGS